MTVRTYEKLAAVSDNIKKNVSRNSEDAIVKDASEGNVPENKYRFINERSSQVNIEEWTYNFGPSRFIRTLLFEQDKLVLIEEGDYGFDSHRGNILKAQEADTKAVVWFKDGPPRNIVKNVSYDVSVDRKEDGEYLYVKKHLKPVVEETWTYDLGPEKYLQELNFKKGRLVRIHALKTKGSKE